MKQPLLTVEQIMAWVRKIKENPDVSIPMIQDNAGKWWGVKVVTEYVSAFLQNLDNGNLLIAANQPIPGIRSIGGVQLDKSKYQAVLEANLLYDDSQDLLTDAALALLPFATAATGTIKNCEVRLLQSGELFRTVGSDLYNGRAATSNDDDFRTITPNPIIRGGHDFNWNIKLPLGGVVALGAAIQIRWRAIEFTPAGNV